MELCQLIGSHKDITSSFENANLFKRVSSEHLKRAAETAINIAKCAPNSNSESCYMMIQQNEKAAALFESIAQNHHPFYNANKRTALASLIVFLKINHYRWTTEIEEEQDFTVDVVNHKYTFEEIVSIIKENTEIK